MRNHDDDAQARLLRDFAAVVSGTELADLHRVGVDLAGGQEGEDVPVVRPDLRRPRRDGAAVFRVRVDLVDDVEPFPPGDTGRARRREQVWRLLELRSDLTLDVVHLALQAAFGWTDSRLHRFSLGGGPFDRWSQLFLCPAEIEDIADLADVVEGDEGLPTVDVRLDETLREPGDLLRYDYDYGDRSELRLQLEEVRPAGPDCPAAVAVAGGGAAPSEQVTDCDVLYRGVGRVPPTGLDLDAVNRELRGAFLTLTASRADRRLVALLARLRHTTVGAALADRAMTVVEPLELGPEAVSDALVAHRWFLDRAADGGIPLTAAGYLRPVDVVAACEVLPEARSWTSKHNRENNALPLLRFRESLQAVGLLRKHRGALVLTPAGRAAQADPKALWTHLAERMIPDTEHSFDHVGTLLLLVAVASSPGEPLPREQVAAVLTDLGWRMPDGSRLAGHEIDRVAAFPLLRNVAEPSLPVVDGARTPERPLAPGHRSADGQRVTSGASALARAALLSGR